MQSIFQASQAQASHSTGHLRVAPIMMSAGVLLLIATGLLFLFSKPESTIPSHFRQPTRLSGADRQKPAAGASDARAPVTENQLTSSDTSASSEKKADLQNVNGSRDMAAMRRLSIAGAHERRKCRSGWQGSGRRPSDPLRCCSHRNWCDCCRD